MTLIETQNYQSILKYVVLQYGLEMDVCNSLSKTQWKEYKISIITTFCNNWQSISGWNLDNENFKTKQIQFMFRPIVSLVLLGCNILENIPYIFENIVVASQNLFNLQASMMSFYTKYRCS